MAQVNEIVTKFSFRGSIRPLDDFNESLGDAIGFMTKAVAGITAVAAAFNGLAVATLRGADELNKLQRQTGLTISELQDLRGVSASLGLDFSSVVNSAEQLQIKIGEAAQKGVEEFDRLGISVRDSNGNVKSSTQIMAEVGAAFNRLDLSMAEQRSFADALGLDPDSLALIRTGSDEMARIIRESNRFGKITKEQSQQIREFNQEYDNLAFGIGRVSEQIALEFAPDLTELIDTMGDLLAESKDFIVNGARALVTALKSLGRALERLAPVFAVMGAAFVALKVASLGLGGALSLVLSPVVVMTGLIAASVLAVDDLIVAFQGGNSVIRSFIKEAFGIDITPVLQKAVEMVKQIAGIVVEGFRQVGQMISLLFDGEFAKVGDMLVQSFTDAGRKIISLFSGIFDYLKGLVTDLIPDWALDLVGANDRVQTISPVPAQSSTSTSSISQQIQIDVRADDPVMAGQMVSDQLQRQLEDAQIQSRRGGR